MKTLTQYWINIQGEEQFLHALHPNLLSIATDTTLTSYGIPEPIEFHYGQWSTNLNAISLRCPLGRENVSLGIYAKDPHRVRFEVRYRSTIRDIVGRGLEYDEEQSWQDGILPLLTNAREDTATRLEHVFGALQDLRCSPEPRIANFITLNSHIMSVCGGNYSLLRRLYSILSTELGVTVTQDTEDPLRDAVEALVDRRVLARQSIMQRASQSAPPRYGLKEPYRGIMVDMADTLTA